ncbi:MAG: hypothetical protein R3B74_15930 [Nitrospirales bacterium]|nr:hypothetical protein [Nitrospirales bacterium]
MLEPILPIIVLIFFSFGLLAQGVLAFVIFKRLPKPKNEAIPQNLVQSSHDHLIERADQINPEPITLPSPLLQLSFQESLDIQQYEEACQNSAIPYLNEQLQFGVANGITLTINTLRLKSSGIEMIFRASKDGQQLLDQALAVMPRHKNSGQLLPILKDASTGKIIEQLKGAQMATTLSRLGALSAAVVGAAHIVAGADIAKRLKRVEERLDILIAFRRIDQVATLERIYTSAKELASEPMNPIKRRELWRLRGELRELRIAWRLEWRYHLNQIEDPKADNWFIKMFTIIPITPLPNPVTMAAHYMLRKKQDTKEAKITRKISEGQAQVDYIEYSLRLEHLLAVASGTEKEFMVTLADDLQQFDAVASLLDRKSAPLLQKEGIEPVVRTMREIVKQYRSLLPDQPTLHLLTLSEKNLEKSE